MRGQRRLLGTIGLCLALTLAVAGGAVASGKGKDKERDKGSKKGGAATPTIVLPGEGIFPEGIAAKGSNIYTGSAADGRIFRASRGGSTGELLSPAGDQGRTAAIGMKIDRSGHLVVAGGPTGTVFVLDRKTGSTLGKFARPAAGAYAAGTRTFLNDLTIAKNGDAYITDSFSAVIYRIPAASLAAPTMTGVLEEWLTLAGTPIVYQNGFNLNGIVAYKNRTLLTVQANTGKLFRIQIGSKTVTEVALNGADITGGDGLVLHDERLYVVNSGAVDVLKLKKKFRSARLKTTITDGTFDSPTTAALHKGRLYVVNSQFGKRAAGTAAPPFTISVVKPGKGRK